MGFSADAISPNALIKRMDERWRKIQQFQAELSQAVEIKGASESSRYIGSLYIQRGSWLRLDFQLMSQERSEDIIGSESIEGFEPFQPDDIYLANPEFMIHYSPREKKVTRQYLWQSGLPPMLQALAGTGHFETEEFKRNYDKKRVEEEDIQGQPTYLMNFVPKGEQAASLPTYQFWIHRETLLPVRLRVISREEEIDVEFKMCDVEKPLPENIFDIRFPEDVQIIDRTQEL